MYQNDLKDRRYGIRLGHSNSNSHAFPRDFDILDEGYILLVSTLTFCLEGRETKASLETEAIQDAGIF